jgi:hypothetical protein
MNGYQFAEDNPLFKESVGAAIDSLTGNGCEPEEITVELISDYRMVEIKADWYKCLTVDDIDQIKTGIAEEDQDVEKLDEIMNAEFQRVRDVEIEHQINLACVERQVRERGGL